MEKQNTSAVNATATVVELDDFFWDDLLTRIQENEVVPIVGRGVVTFGPGDELLYPWMRPVYNCSAASGCLWRS